MQAIPPETNQKTLAAANLLWNYMRLDQPLKQVELIFVLGSRDDRVAVRAAELYKRNISKHILISGGIAHQNDLLATKWSEKNEAEHFAAIMLARGVPSEAIILETKATSTGENILFGFEALKNHGHIPKSMLIITKPYMERRAYATFKKQWPGPKIDILLSSPPLSFKEYFNDEQPFEEIINIMVGDMQRIIEYPARGFQVSQKVPVKAQKAYQFLIQAGYNKHLLQR